MNPDSLPDRSPQMEEALLAALYSSSEEVAQPARQELHWLCIDEGSRYLMLSMGPNRHVDESLLHEFVMAEAQRVVNRIERGDEWLKGYDSKMSGSLASFAMRLKYLKLDFTRIQSEYRPLLAHGSATESVQPELEQHPSPTTQHHTLSATIEIAFKGRVSKVVSLAFVQCFEHVGFEFASNLEIDAYGKKSFSRWSELASLHQRRKNIWEDEREALLKKKEKRWRLTETHQHKLNKIEKDRDAADREGEICGLQKELKEATRLVDNSRRLYQQCLAELESLNSVVDLEILPAEDLVYLMEINVANAYTLKRRLKKQLADGSINLIEHTTESNHD